MANRPGWAPGPVLLGVWRCCALRAYAARLPRSPECSMLFYLGRARKLREASRGARATGLPLPPMSLSMSNAYGYKPDAELMVSGELILILCAPVFSRGGVSRPPRAP